MKVAPKEGVGAGGEDGDLVAGLGREGHVGALAAADPVDLGRAGFVRPVQAFQVLDQLVGVVGDLEEPLGQLALGDVGVVAPAGAVGVDFLVGQGAADGAPPLQAGGPVGQPALEEFQEHPLGPAVVLGVGGVDLAIPVKRPAGQVQLPLVVGAPLAGQVGRVAAGLDGGVFGGQAKGVPAHGMQHVVTAHAHDAGDHISWHVVAQVTDAEPVARGIGKEVEAVEGGAVGRLGRAVQVLLGPAGAPLGIDFGGAEVGGHGEEPARPGPERQPAILGGSTLSGRIPPVTLPSAPRFQRA